MARLCCRVSRLRQTDQQTSTKNAVAAIANVILVTNTRFFRRKIDSYHIVRPSLGLFGVPVTLSITLWEKCYEDEH